MYMVTKSLNGIALFYGILPDSICKVEVIYLVCRKVYPVIFRGLTRSRHIHGSELTWKAWVCRVICMKGWPWQNPGYM